MLDQGESSEVDIQEDIEFALIQMKSETLEQDQRSAPPSRRRDLRQLLRVRRRDRPDARLRALPFAVRCKDCEEARENAEQRERALARAERVVRAVLRHVQLNAPARRFRAA